VGSNDDIRLLYEPFRGTDYYIPLGEVALEDFQLVENTLSAVGGVQWQKYSTRFYPGGGLTPYGGGLAPHAVGYVGWIFEENLDEYLELGYQGDEYVGQMGLEFVHEAELRGKPGGTLYVLDAEGQEIATIAERDSEPPYAVYTTIDRDLQLYAQQAIENFVGAVVVLERDTGAVLAMASAPGFDPNLFDTSNPNYSLGIQELLENPDRAVDGLDMTGAMKRKGQPPVGSPYRKVWRCPVTRTSGTLVLTCSTRVHRRPYRIWQRSLG
jgi:penicillin-binding protein 2